MLSKTELRALSGVCDGADGVTALSDTLGLSVSQTYKVVGSLSEKGLARLDRGVVHIERLAHTAILLEILDGSPDSYIPLSDSGLEIVRALAEPRSVADVSRMTGLHQTTITRKIDLMMRMGMVRKERGSYSLNGALWPRLVDLSRSYDAHSVLTDPRMPFGSKAYHSSGDALVFSSNRELDCARTAFSRYGDFGMLVHPGTNYYTSQGGEPGIEEVFLHSLYVVERDGGWRGRMLALIFYVKHRRDLDGVRHPIVDEMRTVLSGGRVEGWAPLGEMEERARMYGVDLLNE
ncbi:MAG: hypothetical protein FWH47_07630 [Methanomassiliicoccaceae archaeon]|nr:hypothetical protein [Methanomassiliicoccaceae archaeon]